MKSRKKYLSLFKIMLMVLAYAYLAYKLYQFDNYQAFQSAFSTIGFLRWIFLCLVIFLLPLNWLLESMKWRFLCSSFEKISIKTALKSVLSGLFTGFLSPNRIGELVGRPLFLKKENRKSAALMTVINGFSQTITIVACGIPAAFLFFFQTDLHFSHQYQQYTYFVLFLLLFLLLFYYRISHISAWLSKKNIAEKIRSALESVSHISFYKLSMALVFSFLRYFVFCLQYYFLLLFFSVEISIFHASIAIFLYYLCVTITPSMAFSELGIRVSYAILLLGYFSDNTIGIGAAGMLLWLINFVVPMLIGSLYFAKIKI